MFRINYLPKERPSVPFQFEARTPGHSIHLSLSKAWKYIRENDSLVEFYNLIFIAKHY